MANRKGFEKFVAEINKEAGKVDAKKKQYIDLQAKAIIMHLDEMCNDEEYDNWLCLEHKNFRRMWKYVVNNARELAVNNCACVTDATVYGWMDEYLGLDDKEEYEKEKKQAEEAAKRAKEAKDKANSKTAKGKTTKAKTSSKVVNMPSAIPTPEEPVLFDGEESTEALDLFEFMEQPSIFDLM